METVTFCANQLSMFNFFISKISTSMPRNQTFLYLFDTANRYTLHFEQFNNNEDLFKKIN